MEVFLSEEKLFDIKYLTFSHLKNKHNNKLLQILNQILDERGKGYRLCYFTDEKLNEILKEAVQSLKKDKNNALVSTFSLSEIVKLCLENPRFGPWIKKQLAELSPNLEKIAPQEKIVPPETINTRVKLLDASILMQKVKELIPEKEKGKRLDTIKEIAESSPGVYYFLEFLVAKGYPFSVYKIYRFIRICRDRRMCGKQFLGLDINTVASRIRNFLKQNKQELTPEDEKLQDFLEYMQTKGVG